MHCNNADSKTRFLLPLVRILRRYNIALFICFSSFVPFSFNFRFHYPVIPAAGGGAERGGHPRVLGTVSARTPPPPPSNRHRRRERATVQVGRTGSSTCYFYCIDDVHEISLSLSLSLVSVNSDYPPVTNRRRTTSKRSPARYTVEIRSAAEKHTSNGAQGGGQRRIRRSLLHYRESSHQTFRLRRFFSTRVYYGRGIVSKFSPDAENVVVMIWHEPDRCYISLRRLNSIVATREHVFAYWCAYTACVYTPVNFFFYGIHV